MVEQSGTRAVQKAGARRQTADRPTDLLPQTVRSLSQNPPRPTTANGGGGCRQVALERGFLSAPPGSRHFPARPEVAVGSHGGAQEAGVAAAGVERRLYGEGGAGTGAKAKPQCTDAVVKVQVSLGNVAGKRERIKTLYKKIDDLMKYLDPLYMDRIVIPDAMKLELILAEEPFIHSQVTLLESVSKLQPFLESEHIKAVPNYSSKLQSLTQIQIQEQDQCTAVTEDTRKLLDEYNKMTLLLSKQFVQWEEALSKLEAAKQVKPLRD
ncbi:dynactin subunit 3 [Callorhinchus milii]|uniref:dynactin subunit 3 n=1 Tax=Callorhinchus milii TaxID=7868 RepID=UPI001C3FDFF9|nr:dynactin subunit 3 [Callorhinchus milii]